MVKPSTGTYGKPDVMLHGRILFRDRDGRISDVTHQDIFGLKKFAEDGALAMHILNQCRKRLDLLFMAAEYRSHIDAALLRLAVDDLRSDLEEGSELAGYVDRTQELFAHAEALLPIHTLAPHRTRSTLSLMTQNSGE